MVCNRGFFGICLFGLFFLEFDIGYQGGYSRYMTTEEKKKLQVALKRIQGQVGGIEKMISEDKKCEAVVTQVVASMSSLKSVAKALLADAVDSCNKEDYAKLLKRFL
ncbi:MAG: hypothetical protein UW68_C0066G0006 [Candidatus Collierbacteria bacterium GW2011_GWB1_44_6]|uniref:Copper-sensing transcriptional repressor CsoR n=2 Tax=Candidatus Collieribacteriota TaxID=1752725 RepID=A0A0G1LRK7_9BACT|nr:MAG: hypothetical protein UV68_C0056G0006 [Candidatus Collierbacteria bacterium GW2011_GWC2_43_12]KKT71462.1 MAG: hypothetical protein UW68_C0066G0006 [Candidatus Collierbacteria bacterium GW2011_GWB1_44_6]KKT83662.1 MAG: hypothetical protein UW80_C0009G0016 [Microgenomates group bacterium GW2011_GWC1_44_9]